MNKRMLEQQLKKGILKEAEKAWDQNKSKFGMNTGSANPATGTPGGSSTVPPPPPPQGQYPPPPPLPVEGEEAEAAQAAAYAAPASAPGVGAPPPTTATGSSGGKQSLQEKLMAKVKDPAVQAKAEKLLKDGAAKKLLGRRH